MQPLQKQLTIQKRTVLIWGNIADQWNLEKDLRMYGYDVHTKSGDDLTIPEEKYDCSFVFNDVVTKFVKKDIILPLNLGFCFGLADKYLPEFERILEKNKFAGFFYQPISGSIITKGGEQICTHSTTHQFLTNNIISNQAIQKLEADARRYKDFEVLVVEDNLINQQVITIFLEKLGCKVICAEKGALAVELVKQKQFKVIFMDVQMPVMNGYDATKAIRAFEIDKGLIY